MGILPMHSAATRQRARAGSPCHFLIMRIAIISDIHLAARDAPNAAGLADLFRLAVDKVRELNVDWVILLGDVVEKGVITEYSLAREILRPLFPKLKVIPGNHEYLEGTPSDFRNAWLVEPATADLMGNLPVMRFNTGVEGQKQEEYFGRVTASQLRLLDVLLETRPNLPLLLFTHHPLRDTVRRSEEFNFAIENSPEVRSRLEKHAGGAVVFSGHTHWQSVAKLSERVTCIGCPPLGFWPHAFLTVEIDSNSIRYESVRMIVSVEQSPDPNAGDASYRAAAEGAEPRFVGHVEI